MNLYTLTSNYSQVLDLIDEGAEMMCLQDTLDSLTDAIEDKAENIAKIIKTIDAEAAALKVEEKRLADRRKSLENRSKGLKDYLQSNLETVGLKKLKGKLFSFNIQKNQASLHIVDMDKIPINYWVVPEPVLDNASIKEALKTGLSVDGAELKVSESLRIR